ncbi:uncharacterized protein LOC113516127 [Galleria mellonella]|uniref:Uncharacterized protein LOC113516127 n=1 Tax=Galleria mellonella TaxID=7137 RepID=A0A6J1WUN3_GALME|nr:uncharacterized protein LOC113516127 [Galleria mellonella]
MYKRYNCIYYENEVQRLKEERQHGVLLPTYSVYLLAFTIVILFVLVIVISYLLYKKSNVRYNIMKEPESSKDTRNYTTQTSNDSTNYNHLLQTQNNNNQSIHLKELTNSSENQETELPKNFRETYSKISKQLKIHPMAPPKQNMILKEQLLKICENELTKSQNNGNTTSLKDLHMLLNENNTTRGNDEEKSASTPQLDEYYDVLPNIRPVTAMRSSTALDIPVYDCLPNHSQNLIITDEDTNYTYLMEKQNTEIRESSPEPDYINASFKFQKCNK